MRETAAGVGRAQSVQSGGMGLRGRAGLDRNLNALNPWLLFAVLCGTIISLGLIGATAYGHGIGADFSALWRASRGQPYAPDNYAPFAYPPTTLIWLKPLILLPFWPAFALWSVLSLGCYSAVTRRPLLLVSPAIVQCLVFGQTSLLIAALILQPRWKGLAIGLALTLKPQLLFMAPLVFARRRDWVTVRDMAIGAMVSMVVSVLLFGFHTWTDWLAAIPHFNRVVADRNLWWVTITPYGTAMRFGLNPWPWWTAGAALAVFTFVRSRADPLPLSVLCSLLASPYAIAHDLVALLPFAIAETNKRNPFGALLFSGALAPLALIGLALKHDDRKADRIVENVAG